MKSFALVALLPLAFTGSQTIGPEPQSFKGLRISVIKFERANQIEHAGSGVLEPILKSQPTSPFGIPKIVTRPKSGHELAVLHLKIEAAPEFEQVVLEERVAVYDIKGRSYDFGSVEAMLTREALELTEKFLVVIPVPKGAQLESFRIGDLSFPFRKI